MMDQPSNYENAHPPAELPVDWWSAKRKAAVRIFRNEGARGIWKKIGAGGWHQAARRIAEELRCIQAAVFCHFWDKRNNVQTSGLIGMEQVSVVGSNKMHGNAIVSISPMTFIFFTRFFPANRTFCTLVDFGSGKGRLVLMASKLGFRKVIGVEFSPFAYKVAQDNLMNFRSRHDKLSECLFVNEDAVKFELPSDRSLVLVFNNPFGIQVWKQLLPRIITHHDQFKSQIRILLVGSMIEVLGPVARFIGESKNFIEVEKGVSPLFRDTYSKYYYWVFDTSRGN
jgi:SAM-dependent methyltransferase